MTKKEMLMEMCFGATECRANKEKVEQFYQEFKRLEGHSFGAFKSKNQWQNCVCYILGAK